MFINGAGHGSQAFLRAHPHRRLRPATIARIRRSLRHDSKLSLVQELPRRRPARNQSGPLSEHSGRPRRHRRALPRQGGVHQHGLRPDLQPHGCAHQGTRRLPPESRPQARRPRRHHDAEPSAVRHRHVRLPARGLHRRQHQPPARSTARCATPRRRRSSSSRTSPRHSRTPCPARSASTSSRPPSATSSRSSSARSSTSSCAR